MIEVKIDGLIFCPLCGAEAVTHRNSRNRFRISCSHCGASTDWGKKTAAVIQWYNMHFTLHANRFLRNNPQVKIS